MKTKYDFFFLAFIYPKIIWDRLLVQSVLSDYQFLHLAASDFRYLEGKQHLKVKLVISIFGSANFTEIDS